MSLQGLNDAQHWRSPTTRPVHYAVTPMRSRALHQTPAPLACERIKAQAQDCRDFHR
jgi:hypothetical protein